MVYHEEMTNEQRAKRAMGALLTYTANEGRVSDIRNDERDAIREAATDLICDLLHLAAGDDEEEARSITDSSFGGYMEEMMDERAANN